MPDLLTNLFFPIIVSILGGVVVSIIEYSIIQPAKEKANARMGISSTKRHFKIAWSTIAGGLIGAIVFPIVVAIFPDWKQIILDAFSFITSDPVEGGALILTIGVILGCLIGAVYKNVLGALIYAPIMGLGIILIIWVYGGIILVIFQFGKWDHIGSLLSEWSKWGFWGGALIGAIVGAGMGHEILGSLGYSQLEIPVQEPQSIMQLPSANLCPKCGLRMTVQQVTTGVNTGKLFFVCPNYQNCGQAFPVK